MKLCKRRFFCTTYVFVFICGLALLLLRRRQNTPATSEGDQANFGYAQRAVQNDGSAAQNAEYFPDTAASLVTSKMLWGAKVPLEIELRRTGLGEGGEVAHLPREDEEKKKELWDVNGFHALLSDSIAFDRSLKDIRNPKCAEFKYNAELPTVSVVIPFFEEHWSTLLRTVVSVINRSPVSLLKEIILVDDGSTMKDFLKSKLDNYLRDNLPLARVLRLPERVGLIMARQEGIRTSIGDVIVVLDSHCEVMTGWLPPLLEPIVANPRTAVCPLIDIIDSGTFAYYPQDEGGRGAFDWRLYYKRLPLTPKDKANLPKPFENPVMNGGLFAISRHFFWELGGYDPGIKIWGGEQYDLSFKIWQCGGRLLDAPCSRVGHIFRNGGSKRPAAKNAGDFLSVNYKRVALVWMDEYIEALYRRNSHLRTVDAGDVTNEINIRKRLQCKSFKWYLENIAPDLVKDYPPLEPPDFANGTIKSVKFPTQCIDTGSKESGDLIMYGCHGENPQIFALGYKKTIRVQNEQFCWSSPTVASGSPELKHCQKEPPPPQIWRYEPRSQQLQSKSRHRCLDVNPKTFKLQMAKCDAQLDSQKWIFKHDAALIKSNYPSL